MSAEAPEFSDRTPLEAVRSDHGCFGCGAWNPMGLHLRFAPDNRGVRASFVPLPDHQGFENVTHGGIISTVLDEAMDWATAAAGFWAVTGEFRVRFRRPLRIGEPTTVAAHVTSTRGHFIFTFASLKSDTDGAELAMATGTFLRVNQEIESAWRARYLRPVSLAADAET